MNHTRIFTIAMMIGILALLMLVMSTNVSATDDDMVFLTPENNPLEQIDSDADDSNATIDFTVSTWNDASGHFDLWDGNLLNISNVVVNYSFDGSETTNVIILEGPAVLYALSNLENPRAEIFHAIEELRDSNRTSIIISNIPTDRNFFGIYDSEDFLSDGIIHLQLKKTSYVTHFYMTIIEIRHTTHDHSFFPLPFDDGSFEILTDDSGYNIIHSPSRGYFLPDGLERFWRSHTIPDDPEMNQFLADWLKNNSDDSGDIIIFTTSRGYYLPDGPERHWKSFTIPDDPEMNDFLADWLKNL